MRRVKDLMIGCVLGAMSTAAVVAFAAEQTMDPLQLSPQFCTLRIDNPRVGVYEYRLPPGQNDVMHTHLPGVVFELANATLKLTLPDGTSSTHAATTGEVAWRDSVTHAIENMGPTDVHAYAVELKGCTS